MGRPKGSKNRPKMVAETPVVTPVILDEWFIPGGKAMMQLTDIDPDVKVSLLAHVPGKGDWDFLVKSPFFRLGPVILSPTSPFYPRSTQEELIERIQSAWVGLGPDGLPVRLVLFLEVFTYQGWQPRCVDWVFPPGHWGDQEYETPED